MKLTSLATLLLSAAFACAENNISFVSLDHVDRTVYFTPNPGSQEVEPAKVPGGQNLTVTFPHGWQGNAYAVAKGAKNVPGMLAEVAFNSWSDISFFDVSQIVNQTDFNGIKQMWPAGDRAPVSGCVEYLGVVCDNVYLQPDDVQTKATTETALICTLGTATNDTAIKPRDVPADDSPVFTRDFVLGKWSSKRH